MKPVLLCAVLLLGGCGVAALSSEEAAACGCTHVMPSNHYRFDGAVAKAKGGDVVCFEGGSRGPINIRNVVGEEGAPIVVRNCKGAVVTTQYHYSISVERSRYLRITGTGDAAVEYGFQLGGTLGAGTMTSDIEIDHVEVKGASFAGLMLKTDPTCDPATWKENFEMANVKVHDNYIHATGDGEGMYIGYTAYERTLECNGVPTVVYPHDMRGLVVENNVLKDLGADGIQVSKCLPGCRVENNLIEKYGQRPFAHSWQNNGIQVNGEAVVVAHNRVVQGSGNGLIIFGSGHKVLSNTVIGAGGNGMFCDSRPVPTAAGEGGVGQHYEGNTFYNVGLTGMHIYHRHTTTPVTLAYNTVVNAKKFIDTIPGVVLSQKGNRELSV
eukprot:TRINITY_DN423_c0_g1_i1.p2 TRINITY_DN423_c0_g1~~TRINITY_DN423_c0_g1_i1.p2  ORF type:complete len:398 (+),score=153.42 TRINITY_DN423_c0_g1_i1:49-1194(+)